MSAEGPERETESSNPFVRIYRSIARDQDFAKLDPDAKVIYFRLLVDPDNNSAGLFTLAVGRWAKWANMSLERTWTALRALDTTGFVVLDEGQEELVVRTKLRNDTLIGASSWKTQKGALTATLKAVSPRIRVAMAEEIEKCRGLLRSNILDYADEVVWELRSDVCIEAGIEAYIDTNWKQTTDHRPSDHRPSDRRPQTADSQTSDRQTSDPSNVTLGRGSGGTQNFSDDDDKRHALQALRDKYPDQFEKNAQSMEPLRVLAHLAVLREHFHGAGLTVSEVAKHKYGDPIKSQLTSTREGLQTAVDRGLAVSSMNGDGVAVYLPLPTDRWQP